MEATTGSTSSPLSPLPIPPDQKLPQCLPSLLLSGEVNPEALLGAQAAERGVYGSRGPSFAGILGTQAPGGCRREGGWVFRGKGGWKPRERPLTTRGETRADPRRLPPPSSRTPNLVFPNPWPP